ncbi:threonine synthase [Niveibacterium sp. SC-1]|uniref:threonine synthase n=1 Tax=Niveibacterium sp. SC-1 TaxID=3135646 RepID=UPI00311D8E38
MKYVSTRGKSEPKHFLDILLGGLMEDGGLAMPESYPKFSFEELEALREMNYRDLAFAVLSRFADDIPAVDLKTLIDRTYTAQVYCNGRDPSVAEAITPVKRLEHDLYLLELSNGPTLAFKDMAMQLLGSLFEYALDREHASLNILGATSGDTGSAAEYAMRGKRGVKVFMLSPWGKMSPFQRAQMYSLPDANIFNIAVRGMFDDAQDIVKAVSNDLEFKRRYAIGTVNSINWARVSAQVVYYFKAYFAVTQRSDQKVSFAVPSGNFGNVCAGHIARMMGLPIAKLVVATNENDVLDEFFRTGVYRPRKTAETHATSSPSMDISKASNFERFVFDLIGRDAKVLSELWTKVDKGEAFDLSATPFFGQIGDYGFQSGRSSHEDRLRVIREAFERFGVTIDTHTADGLKVALERREPGVPMIVLETALPAKFEETIVEALGQKPPRPAGLEGIEQLPQRVEVMDVDADAVKAFIRNNAE